MVLNAVIAAGDREHCRGKNRDLCQRYLRGSNHSPRQQISEASTGSG